MVRVDGTGNEGQMKLRGKVGLGLRITCHELRMYLIMTNPKQVRPGHHTLQKHLHTDMSNITQLAHGRGQVQDGLTAKPSMWWNLLYHGRCNYQLEETGGETILKDKLSLCMVPHENYGVITWKLQSKDRIRNNPTYWFLQKNNIVMLLKYIWVLNFLNLFTMLLYVTEPKYTPWMNIILGQSFSTKSVMPQLVIVTPTRFLDFNIRTYKKKKF